MFLRSLSNDSEIAAIPISKIDPKIYAKKSKEYSNLNEIINVPYYKDNYKYKVPSGYLIEEAGWKGNGMKNVKVSEKHALVLTTNGNLDGIEMVRFADSIIDDIYDKFKVKLEIEPTLI